MSDAITNPQIDGLEDTRSALRSLETARVLERLHIARSSIRRIRSIKDVLSDDNYKGIIGDPSAFLSIHFLLVMKLI